MLFLPGSVRSERTKTKTLAIRLWDTKFPFDIDKSGKGASVHSDFGCLWSKVMPISSSFRAADLPPADHSATRLASVAAILAVGIQRCRQAAIPRAEGFRLGRIIGGKPHDFVGLRVAEAGDRWRKRITVGGKFNHAAADALIDARLRAGHPVLPAPEVSLGIEHQPTDRVNTAACETQRKGEVIWNLTALEWPAYDQVAMQSWFSEKSDM